MQGEVKAGRYELMKEIGRGGMGVVYSARDLRLGRKVAVKLLPRDLTHSPELQRRLAQEARAASAFTHPGVATVYDYVDEPEDNFIVYEYVEGVTLRERLRSHRFTTEETLDIGMQLADALAAAHERGIIHRDLKPENIMLSPGSARSGQVKILDFGLAKFRHPLSSTSQGGDASTAGSPASTAAGTLIGTVNYMSPEQLEGEPVDHRSDNYALGLVLYEMATGINPFVGKTPTSTIANILKQEPPPLQQRNPVAPAELGRILHKCLRKRREERYQSARELHVDLSNLRRDLVEPVRQAPPLEVRAPLEIPRALARTLFLLIQAGYLVMYGIFFVLHKGPGAARFGWGVELERWLFIWLFLAASFGTAVRLYLLSAVGFDYYDTGRLFRQMFFIVLAFDGAWSAAPLLLYQKLGLIVFLFIPALAYLPFSQRTLVFSAYFASGGRTSGVKTGSSV